MKTVAEETRGAVDESSPPPSSLRNNWKSRVHVWSCSSYLYLHILPVESWLWPLCGWCINGHRHHHHPLNLTARHSSIDIAVSLPAATQLNPRTVRAPPSYISTHMLCVHHKSSTCVEEKISPQTILLLNIWRWCWHFFVLLFIYLFSLLFVLFFFYVAFLKQKKTNKQKNGASRRCVSECVGQLASHSSQSVAL